MYSYPVYSLCLSLYCVYIQWSGLFRKDVQIMWAVVKSIHAHKHKHKTITFALNVLCASTDFITITENCCNFLILFADKFGYERQKMNNFLQLN